MIEQAPKDKYHYNKLRDRFALQLYKDLSKAHSKLALIDLYKIYDDMLDSPDKRPPGYNIIKTFEVGTVVRLLTDLPPLKAKDAGICYAINNQEAHILFGSGNYSTFDTRDPDGWGQVVGFCPGVANYRFKGLSSLIKDFQKGHFSCLEAYIDPLSNPLPDET